MALSYGSHQPSAGTIQLPQHEALLVLFILLAGRNRADGPSVGAIAGNAGVFGRLGSIRLGMSSREVSDLRSVRSAPYIGLAEQVAGGRLEYRFGKEAPGEGQPQGNLTLITARYSFETAAAADSAARTSFDSLVKVIGPPSECLDTKTGFTRAAHAAWRRAGGVLELVAVRNRADSAARLGLPVRSMLLTVRDANVDAPLRTGSAKVLPPERCRAALTLVPEDSVRTP